jgi:uncharacterized phage-like protein YoqJ
LIVAATGHRPDKLGGYTVAARGRLVAFAESVIPRYAPSEFISGMALGWDTACALACLSLGIPLVAAVPFEGQESKWPEDSQRVYRWILSRAARVEIVCPGAYGSYKMQARNQWMVDRCDKILALWDGSNGGTANCINYADRTRKLYGNPYHEWLRWVEQNPLP